MKVVFFHRKNSAGYFSLENLFDLIRTNLPRDVNSIVKIMRFDSEGFFKRIYCCVEAFFAQEDVNHVTGDIHFIAIFLHRKRTVLTIHDLGFMSHPNPLARVLLKWFWIQLPVWRSACITTVSKATKQELLKYFPVHSDRIRVIYDPISPMFKPHPKTFNKQKPILLQVGTTSNKNVIRLVEALYDIPCKLQIIGELQPEIVSLMKKLNLDFSITKNLTDDQMIGQYIDCDILCFVSTLEGFGLPIVEANAIGRVVVTSNISSMPEIAGDAAHFVNPFDIVSIREGILKVIHDDTYRDKLIKIGYENRKRFDEKQIANEYAHVYRSLHRSQKERSINCR